jgi:23S rRNA (cytidine2498-2'-O)-methyltransferase
MLKSLEEFRFPMPQELPPAEFLFATCQVGAERALKDEMARSGLAMTPAFARPGFVTFKLAEPLSPRQTLAALKPCFARTLAASIGRVENPEMSAAADELWRLPAVREWLPFAGSLDLHVWERDRAEPGQHGFRPAITPLAEEVAAAVWRAAPHDAVSITPPALGKASSRNRWALDVVLVEPAQWYVGCHRTDSWPLRWPGGIVPLELPEHAVSRAYLKTTEALLWARLPMVQGDLCAELGCAPGGSSQALLDRRMRVLGIDPAELDEAVLSHPDFKHVQKRARDIRRRDFRDVTWLLADMNVAPTYTLDAVEDIVTHPSVHIRGLVLTLKLLEWSMAAELPGCAARVRSWGYRDVRLRQLASGGREVCLVALRSRAQRRIRRQRERPSTSAAE